MLQSLKNKGKILGLVTLLGISTSILPGCFTPTSGYKVTPKMEQAIQEAIQRRNEAYSNRLYIPTRSGFHKLQDLSTVGERGRDFKDCSDEEYAIIKEIEEGSGSNMPRRDMPTFMNIEPGIYK